MSEITLTIDGQEVTVPEGTTVLEAAKVCGIDIPHLCYHPDLKGRSSCRICVVEVDGKRPFEASCTLPVREGMVVRTNSPELREARRMNLELLLARHPQDCLTCVRNQNCELQTLAEEMGIENISFEHLPRDYPVDDSNPAIIREPEKCVLCGRCVEVCQEVQQVQTLYPINRGFDTIVTPAFAHPLADEVCTYCGQCIQVCPVGAIRERDDTEMVWEAINDPDIHVVVQTAPAIRVSLGEEMGLGVGGIVTGQMVAVLRRLGFDKVFDTNFTADLTIMEEGHEFIARLQEGGKLPLITSCSPGWIKFCEHYYPQLLDNLSTCKSPQQMFGAMAKTYYAEKAGIDPAKIFVVSIMPCTAKKFERTRPEMTDTGFSDVDAVLTTRELGKMISQTGIDIAGLPDEDFDDPLGISTGAAAIFGATGGVMEAALRTAYEVITGQQLEQVDFYSVRGIQGIKEAELEIDGQKICVAVAHGLGNARKILDEVVAGDKEYHFIEIMACPGGCIGGGGQPQPTTMEKREQRIKAIYEVDASMELRKSHENPAIKKLYEEYLGEPLGHKSHQLLHTTYVERGIK